MTDRGRAAEGFSFGRRWERSPRRLFYALPQAPRHAPRVGVAGLRARSSQAGSQARAQPRPAPPSAGVGASARPAPQRGKGAFFAAFPRPEKILINLQTGRCYYRNLTASYWRSLRGKGPQKVQRQKTKRKKRWSPKTLQRKQTLADVRSPSDGKAGRTQSDARIWMTYALTQSARLIFRPSTPAIALSPHTRLRTRWSESTNASWRR